MIIRDINEGILVAASVKEIHPPEKDTRQTLLGLATRAQGACPTCGVPNTAKSNSLVQPLLSVA